MREEKILRTASFDARLPKYWMLSALLIQVGSIIGIPLVPFWLVFGWRFHQKQYERMQCELTERTLNVRMGYLIRVEKAIPLDKIQDLSVKEGPLLRWIGLCNLGIETAGHSGAAGNDVNLTGIVDVSSFRDAVLNQRDRVVSAGAGATSEEPPARADIGLLTEIRDILTRIERKGTI